MKRYRNWKASKKTIKSSTKKKKRLVLVSWSRELVESSLRELEIERLERLMSTVVSLEEEI